MTWLTMMTVTIMVAGVAYLIGYWQGANFTVKQLKQKTFGGDSG